MNYAVRVFRDPKGFRLRKWNIQLLILPDRTDDRGGEPKVVDHRYMFGFGDLESRIRHKTKRMFDRRELVDHALSKYNKIYSNYTLY